MKLLIIFLSLCLFIFKANCIAVMSIDLGSEWMKVAIVSPGVPMEIALNKESQRKTPVIVAFRDGERMFGDAAATIGVRFPDKAYAYVLDLLGKNIDNPVVKLYQKNFPYYKLVEIEGRDSFAFVHPDGMQFTPEELLAMILKQAQETAKNSAGYPIKDAVVTVPPYFNQAERRAVLLAAELANLNVLQLINTNTAAALNYGIFRRKDFNESNAQNIMFFDMGASSTVATIASYQVVKTKEKGFVESNPQLTIKGIGYDRTLGGLEMQLRLQEHLGKLFNEQKKTKTDVFTNKRSMAKLLKEAGRVKKVLSANTEHIAQVENLLEDQDFRTIITRQQLEDLCENMFERIKVVIERALQSSGMTMKEIDQIILAGSGTRMPKVQQILLETTGFTELGKSINTDEAAALGAAYQAAHLSKGFKVKTFIVKDANILPIQVDFQREVELEKGSLGKKIVKRMLFYHGNPFPQKKVMTFSRHVNDFEFHVNYADLEFLSSLELKSLGSLNISSVSISGVSDALAKHSEENSESKGVKAHFKLDESGLLKIEKIESVFEKKIEEEEEPIDIESTLTKLGNTIGKLFSGNAEEAELPSDSEETSAPAEEINANKEEESKPKQQPAPENDTKQADDKSEANNASSTKNETSPETKKIKLVTVKEPLESKKEIKDFNDPSNKFIEESKKRLEVFDANDAAKYAREMSKNNLESFIMETKDKLYTSEYEKAISDADKEAYLAKLSEASDWLEYDSDEAPTKDIKSKLSDLKALTKPMFERVTEHRRRPEALQALNEMLNISTTFLGNAKKMNGEEAIFTDVELGTLEKLITDTEEWRAKSIDLQKQTPKSEAPKMTVKEIGEKIGGLDREVKYLLNKVKLGPKKKKEPEKKEEPAKETKEAPAEEEKIPAQEETPEVNNEKPEEKPELESENAKEKSSATGQDTHAEL